MLFYQNMLIRLFLIGFFCVSTGYAQEISGTVKSEDGFPLMGASVVILGTSMGTLTNAEGQFTLEATPGDSVKVSFIGYTSAVFSVSDTTSYEVVMSEELKLDQVVIVGYTAQSRRNVTGAVTSLDVEQALQVPSTNISETLQGRVPGITVGQEGGPGGGTMVRIRGFGTIGNNQPLFVIDGVPTRGNLNDINPNDVESIQVLKDASAASIYGSRAGNGVIIVTTKSGKVGQPTLTFNSYYGVQNLTSSLPEVLSAQQFGDMLWQAQINDGQSPSHPHFGSGATPSLPAELAPGVPLATQGTNWLNEIFQNAPMQNYNLSATGGTENGSYAFSTGYFNQEGVLIHTNFERFTARANTRFKVKDKITLGENLTISYSKNTGISNQNTENPISMAIRMPSVIPVYANDGRFAGTSVGGFNNPQNPVGALYRNRFDADRRFRAFGNAYLEIEILPSLVAKSSIGIDFISSQRTDFTGINYEDAEVVGTNKLDEYADFLGSYTWYNTLNYSTDIQGSELNILVGTEAIQNQATGLFASRTGFFTNDPDFRVLSVGSGGIGNAGTRTSSRLFSLFSSISYTYNDFLLFSGTIRRDGSSRFGSNNRYAIFPALSAGIRLSELGGLGNTFDDLKVRFGWGQTGNQEIGDYASFTLFDSDVATTFYDIQGTNGSSLAGFALSTQGNDEVRWETTTSTNIGVDATLLDYKLNLVLDLYTRNTRDMLVQVPQPATAGFAELPFINVGEMRNRGIDFAATYGDDRGAFTYDLGFNISVYRNEVIKLGDNDLFAIAGAQARSFRLTRTQRGFPISYFYGLQVDGIFQTAEEVDASADQGFASAADGVGRFKYVDVNSDGVIDQRDRTLIGNPHPDVTYGVNVNLGYKGFDLSMFIQGSQGNDLYNFTRYFSDFSGVFFQSGKGTAILDAWTPGNPDASLPKLSSGTPNSEVEPNSYFVEDGSFVRIKNLQLGYSLPTESLAQLKLAKVRLYLQGKNLLTFTNYTGLDPELSLQSFGDANSRVANLDIGVDRGAYPITRALLVGIQIGF